MHLFYLSERHVIKWSSTVHPIPTSVFNPHRPWKKADVTNHPHTPFLKKTQLANMYSSNHWTQGRSVRMTTHQCTSGSCYFLCPIHAPSSVQGGGNTASTYLKGILIRWSPSDSSAEELAEEIFSKRCLVSL